MIRRLSALFVALAVVSIPIVAISQTAKHAPNTGIVLPSGVWVSLAPLMQPGTCGYLLKNGDTNPILWQLGPTSAATDGGMGGLTPGTNADAGTLGAPSLAAGSSVSITVTFVSASQGTTIYVRSAGGAAAGVVTLTGGC